MFRMLICLILIGTVLPSCGLEDPEAGDPCDISTMNPFCQDEEILLYCDEWSQKVESRDCPDFCEGHEGSLLGYCDNGDCICP